MHPSGCLVLLNHETFLEIYFAKINNTFPASNRLLTKIPQKMFSKTYKHTYNYQKENGTSFSTAKY